MKSFKIRLSLLCLLLTLTHGGRVRRGINRLRRGLNRRVIPTSYSPGIKNRIKRKLAKACVVGAAVCVCGAVAIGTGGLALPGAIALGCVVGPTVKVAHNAIEGKDTTIGDLALAAGSGALGAVGAHAVGGVFADGVSHAFRHLPAEHMGHIISHTGLDAAFEQSIEHGVEHGVHHLLHTHAHGAAHGAATIVGGSFAVGAAVAAEETIRPNGRLETLESFLSDNYDELQTDLATEETTRPIGRISNFESEHLNDLLKHLATTDSEYVDMLHETGILMW